jgi:phosphoribosylformylglycinamidine synthase
MLICVQKGREEAVLKVFEKWDLPCSEIGEVTGDGLLRFYLQGVLEAEVPAYELVLGGGAPQYTREYKEPAYLGKIRDFNINMVADVTDLKKVAEQLIQIPNIASKRWVTVQYDSMVGAANASTNAPSDAAVVIARGTGKALAMTTDCNSRYVFADPYKGGMIAVAEAARNVVCSGGEPIGVTNCLNFGNPYDPEVYYQFVKAVTGMGDACRRFNTPVTGGNVSFYNQNPEGPVYPTPTIGMVGIIDDFENRMTLDFKKAGDTIILIGRQQNDIGSSEYLHKIREVEYSNVPYFEIEEEYKIQQFVASLIKEKLVNSAHDVSEGGLIVTLIEKGFNRELGFDLNADTTGFRKDAYWLGEAQSRIVVTCNDSQAVKIRSRAEKDGMELSELGFVTGGNLKVNGENWGNIQDWKDKYDTAIEKLL